MGLIENHLIVYQAKDGATYTFKPYGNTSTPSAANVQAIIIRFTSTKLIQSNISKIYMVIHSIIYIKRQTITLDSHPTTVIRH